MSRITTLSSGENETLHAHLEVHPSQASSQFGGNVDYTWDQYEAELRDYCAENQARLVFVPLKKGAGEDYEEASFTKSFMSGDCSSYEGNKTPKGGKFLNRSLNVKKDKDKKETSSGEEKKKAG